MIRRFPILSAKRSGPESGQSLSRQRRTTLAALGLLACWHAAPASAQGGIDQILAANKAASGGAAWDRKATLKLTYAYSGEDSPDSEISSLVDLRRGSFVDTYRFPPRAGANGYDGSRAWERDPSGTITDQAGGDIVPLAVSEAYRHRHLWWRADRGGAVITDIGQKADNGRTYDVLSVAPKDGVPFMLWFDSATHLLARTIQGQGGQSVTISSDYRVTDGVMIPGKLIIGDGTQEGGSTFLLKSAEFAPRLPLSAFRRPEQTLRDYAIAGGSHRTTVPFRLINNHVFVEVSVNGSRPLPFMFDTGGHAILTPDAAKALNVGAKGSGQSSGGGAEVVTSGLGIVQSLRLGDATLTNQPVSIFTFSRPEVEGVEQSGMIGYEFVARFIVSIDYGKRTLTLIDRKHFDPKGAGAMIPLRLYHQFPEVLGSYQGAPGRFGIDTGLGLGLILTGPFAARNDLPKGPRPGTDRMVAWGVGGPSRGFVSKAGDLTLGDVRIPHPLAVISTDKAGVGAQETFPNIVGGGILKRFVVTLDYHDSRMYLKPVEGAVADLDSFNRSGMWINRSPEGFKVIDVTPAGPADAVGILKDDIIVAVDDRSVKSIDLASLRERLRNDPIGSTVRFTVDRDGQRQTRVVVLREAYDS
jgi:hypothetical protein